MKSLPIYCTGDSWKWQGFLELNQVALCDDNRWSPTHPLAKPLTGSLCPRSHPWLTEQAVIWSSLLAKYRDPSWAHPRAQVCAGCLSKLQSTVTTSTTHQPCLFLGLTPEMPIQKLREGWSLDTCFLNKGDLVGETETQAGVVLIKHCREYERGIRSSHRRVRGRGAP